MSESKFRWQRNDEGGLTLQKQGSLFWFSVADVFKAKRGKRWIVRVVSSDHRNWRPIYDQYTAFTLREAMRLTKFIVGVKHGD